MASPEVTRELTFSRFRSAKGVLKSKPISRLWEEWIPVLTTLVPCHEKDTVNFVFGKIGTGETRKDKNVEWIDAMALDIDCVSEETLEQIVDKLSQFEFVMFTSFNHKAPNLELDANNKVRIILPLAERVPPENYKKIQSQFDTLIGGENDKGVAKISQPYYIHSCPIPRRGDAFSIYNAGEWISIQDLPEISQAESVAAEEFASTMQISKQDLRKEARRLARTGTDHKRKMGIYLERVADGEAFVTDQTRDNVMFLMACHLAECWPNIDANHAANLFRDSLEALYQVRQFEIGVSGAITEMGNKIRRKQERIAEERAEQQQVRLSNRERINRNIRPDGQSFDYTDEEISSMADMQRVERSEIEKMAIVYCGSANFFMTQTGYEGPFGKDDASEAVQEYLCPFGNRIALQSVSASGFPSPKSISKLRTQHGQVAKRIEADISAPYSRFNPKTKIFTEATARRDLNLKPVYHAEINEWLTALGGELSEKLLDWVACVTKLDKVCCALVLQGSQGIGKSLLCFGLANLWEVGVPTNLQNATGSFNGTLAKMPLIVADEGMSMKDEQMSEKLRSLIATQSRELNRKYLPVTQLKGAIRLIITTNEDNVLQFKGTHTSESTEAIAKRFLKVEAEDKARAHMVRMVRESQQAEWMLKKIPEHALWLSQNRKVIPGDRFLVEGAVDENIVALVVDNDSTSLICEWLVNWLMSPNALEHNANLENLHRFDSQTGMIEIAAYAIQQAWDTYLSQYRILDLKDIGKALSAISVKKNKAERKRVREIGHGSKRVLHEVIPINLRSWVQKYRPEIANDFEQLIKSAPHLEVVG
tara:strand:- start:5617 stop:8082 length:2466 start_codon:yes stop_codon:yes gene_type:complete